MSEKAPLPESPFLVERLLREARRHQEHQVYGSEAEFRASLQDLIDKGLDAQRLASLETYPTEMAQELAYQAYESEDGEIALQHCHEALQIDPNCADALTIAALLTCEDAGELIEALQHAADCAQEALGEDFFTDQSGDFWSLVEARPYLRTLKQLAEIMWSVGRRFDAVAVYESMLDMDPIDHQGNAALLLSCYLGMGEVQRSWDLLEEYSDDQSALYLWAWVLVELMAMDTEAARDSLTRAIDANPHVISYLFYLEEAEPEVAPYIEAGSEAEARVCAQVLSDAWYRNPDAIMWLQTTLVDLGFLEPVDGQEDPDDEGSMEFDEDDEEEPETKH